MGKFRQIKLDLGEVLDVLACSEQYMTINDYAIDLLFEGIENLSKEEIESYIEVYLSSDKYEEEDRRNVRKNLEDLRNKYS